MFLIKKLVAGLLMPLNLTLLLVAVGLCLLWFSKRQRAGKILVTVGLVLLVVGGSGVVTNGLIGAVENRYEAIVDLEPVQDILWVVVLGAGNSSDANLPAGVRLSEPASVRLMEGVRLHKALPGSRLVVSGGMEGDAVSHAELMAQAAIGLGVAAEDVVVHRVAKDTGEEARAAQAVFGDERFLLVTSASHMLRAMRLFEDLGMQPVAAPTQFMGRQRLGLHAGGVFADGINIRKLERAVYEFMGLLWVGLGGR